MTYGDADFAPGATASSGLPVSYSSSTTGVCTIVSGKVRVISAGDCKVTASQEGNASYSAAQPVERTIVINKAEADITVDGYTGVYDGDPHGATGSATGVKDEDLSGLLNLGSSFTNVPGGTANWSFAGNGNYEAANGTANITINKATPQITWNAPAAINYGTALSGAQLNAQANVLGSFVYSPVAGTVILSGSQTLNAAFTPTDTNNYNNANAQVQIVVNPYAFNGFFQPIDNNGVFNKAKIGSTVSVKFSLGGDKGMNIFAAGYPQVSKPIACGVNPAVDTVEEYSTATNSGLKYDPIANQYIYNWKTESTIKAGECRQLIVKLADGSVAKTANFTFFK